MKAKVIINESGTISLQARPNVVFLFETLSQVVAFCEQYNICAHF